MTSKPEITVTPDDGRGFNKIEVLRDADTLPCTVQGCDASANETWVAAYYAAERIAELEAERDRLRKQNAALAAHVAWMIKGIKQRVDIGLQFALCHQNHEHTREAVKIEQEALRTLLEGTPAINLARIRAEAKAEALHELMERVPNCHDCGAYELADVMRDEYRKAAQEPESTP